MKRRVIITLLTLYHALLFANDEIAKQVHQAFVWTKGNEKMIGFRSETDIHKAYQEASRPVFASDYYAVRNQAITLSKWQPYDFEFKSTAELINPFTVNFTATISGPEGIRMILPGFYDGNNTWKIRFAPTKEGKWQIKTNADIPDLTNQQADVVCTTNTNRRVHGNLLVDNSKRHFIYEDGTHWFPNGYEANWLWALDANDNSLPTLNPFLDKLQSDGFTFILINAYCYDTFWKEGTTEPTDYGPAPLYPWGGSNDAPDFSRYNLAYWQHYDKVIEALHKRGIRAHLYFKVYN